VCLVGSKVLDVVISYMPAHAKHPDNAKWTKLYGNAAPLD